MAQNLNKSKNRAPRVQESTLIYQWNCRGIKQKDAELFTHIEGLDQKPDVVALQETHGRPRLPGYVTYTDPTEKGTAILVRNNIAATQHITPQHGCEHTLIEIHTRTIGNGKNLFVMSAYCRPSQRQYDFDKTVGQAKRLAGNRPLLILGDFNAPHTLWGYKYESKRGKALVRTMEMAEFELLNECGVSTRRGNSVNRDTTPDLTWLKGNLNATWRDEGTDLGSDHTIIGIEIKGPRFRATLGRARITDWDKLRKYIDEEPLDEENEGEHKEDKQTYAEWAHDQKMALAKFTQEVTTTVQTPFVDARLAHMWEARHSLTRRWKRQRRNKKLARRIAVLNREIADKTATHRNLTKVLNTYKGDGRKLVADLTVRYLKTDRGKFQIPETYDGPANDKLDEPFTLAELWNAIDDSNRRSAPGGDTITYTLLGNMSDGAAKRLLGHINRTWETSLLPMEWKEAQVATSDTKTWRRVSGETDGKVYVGRSQGHRVECD
ncbi:uncharacterized protein LOC144167835 [Haemaphysalis longicornis]